MSVPPLDSATASPPRTRGTSEIRMTVAAHVRSLIGEDDDAFTDELIESFQENIRELSAQAEAGYAAGDTQAIVVAAHQIKGSAGNIGLPRIAHDWHAVEMAAVEQSPDLERIVNESILTLRHIASLLDGEPAPPRAFARRASDCA